VNVVKVADGLELDYDLSFDEEIESVLTDLVIAIEEWHGMLPHELNPAECEFYRKRFFVDQLQKTRTKDAVSSNGRRDNLLGQL